MLYRTKHLPHEVEQYFDRLLLSTPVPTMIENLFTPIKEYNEWDAVLDALLPEKVIGVRMGKNNIILNDAWVINLRRTDEFSPANVIFEWFKEGANNELRRAA